MQCNIPVCDYTIIYLFILFIGLWLACSLGLVSVKVLFLFLSGYFGGHSTRLFLSCVYTGVEALGWVVGVRMASEDAAG